MLISCLVFRCWAETESEVQDLRAEPNPRRPARWRTSGSCWRRNDKDTLSRDSPPRWPPVERQVSWWLHMVSAAAVNKSRTNWHQLNCLQMFGSGWERGVILPTGGARPPPRPPPRERRRQPESQSETCTAGWAWPARTAEASTPTHPKIERQVRREKKSPNLGNNC